MRGVSSGSRYLSGSCVVVQPRGQIDDEGLPISDVACRMPHMDGDIDDEVVSFREGELADLAERGRIRPHVVEHQFDLAADDEVTVWSACAMPNLGDSGRT